MSRARGRQAIALVRAALATLALAVSAASQAADPAPAEAARIAPPSPAAAVAGTSGVAEPAVRRTIIEDRGTIIEELRVRGQLQSVIVTPKGAAPAYEVITNSDARDLPQEGKTNSRGAAGKRVWSVLRF